MITNRQRPISTRRAMALLRQQSLDSKGGIHNEDVPLGTNVSLILVAAQYD